MNEFTTLSWQNEVSLTPYPLSKSIGYDGLLIDAHFLQFDSFIPVLNTVSASGDNFLFQITFDKEVITVVVDKTALSDAAFPVVVRSNGRYLGKLVLGSDALSFYDQLASGTKTVNVEFLPFVVKSIPSACGVYKFGETYGAVHVMSDENISYATAGQNVTFSAVALAAESPDNYLKTINSTAPVNNNIFIKDSETIKVTGSASTIQLALVGTSVNNLVVSQNNTIPSTP